jgi:hypothetical protein
MILNDLSQNINDVQVLVEMIISQRLSMTFNGRANPDELASF